MRDRTIGRIVTLAGVLLACRGGAPAPHTAVTHNVGGGIDRPLARSMLVEKRFVVFSDLWAIAVQGGDPIRFLADGRVENLRAGLADTWALLDDTTLVIGRRVFRHRQAERDLFSPHRFGDGGAAPPGDTTRIGTRIVDDPAVRRPP